MYFMIFLKKGIANLNAIFFSFHDITWICTKDYFRKLALIILLSLKLISNCLSQTYTVQLLLTLLT